MPRGNWLTINATIDPLIRLGTDQSDLHNPNLSPIDWHTHREQRGKGRKQHFQKEADSKATRRQDDKKRKHVTKEAESSEEREKHNNYKSCNSELQESDNIYNMF